MTERENPNYVLQVGEHFSLDLIGGWLFSDDKLVPLTQKETGLLALLVEGEGECVCHEDLFTRVWHTEYFEGSEKVVLQGIMFDLRKKLKTVDLDGYLVSVPGTGYKWYEGPENHSP